MLDNNKRINVLYILNRLEFKDAYNKLITIMQHKLI